MKKILAIILALTCAFAMFACNKLTENEEYQNNVSDFVSAMSATDPASLNVTVKVETALGELTSTYTTVYNEDGSSTMTYSIEKFLGIDAEEDKAVDAGTVTCDKDGNYSDGGAVAGKLGATGVSFNISSDKITKYNISGETLTVTVPAADSAAILGVTLDTDSTVTVSKMDGKVVAITLVYTGVSIVCNYN